MRVLAGLGCLIIRSGIFILPYNKTVDHPAYIIQAVFSRFHQELILEEAETAEVQNGVGLSGFIRKNNGQTVLSQK